MNSVKFKITMLVVGCVVLSSAAVGGASIVNSQRVVAADSIQIMELLCSNRSEEIDTLFTTIEQSVETLTVYAKNQVKNAKRFQEDDKYVKSYTAGMQDIAMNAAKNTEGALTVYIRYNPEFTDPESGLFCSKTSDTGIFQKLHPTNLAAYEAADKEHVGWFYEPVKNQKGTWIEPYYNDNINMKMISYVIPYYVDHVLIGVVGMDIDFQVLEDIVENTHVYHTGYAFLTDHEAKIVSHKELGPGTDLTKFNHGEFSIMANTLREQDNNGEDLVYYSFQGKDKKAAFNSLKNGMRLVLTAPTSEIDEQANTLIEQIAIAVLLIVSVTIIMTCIFTRKLVKPLLELTEAAKKIAAGDMSISITHHSNDEVGNLAESFRQTVAHLHKYISYINELAYRDSLTGVKNKTAYLEMVVQMNDLMRLKKPQYAVLVFDINGLKKVNDNLGHDFGDILIINACQIICTVFRRSPIYRIGGDEFVVLLENADYEQYHERLNQLQMDLNNYNENPQNELKVSIARGIAIYTEETDLNYNDVFKRADSAMYCNKEEMRKQQ